MDGPQGSPRKGNREFEIENELYTATKSAAPWYEQHVDARAECANSADSNPFAH